jgi:hypothetical protein
MHRRAARAGSGGTAVAALPSASNRWITGQRIEVPGGMVF